MSEPRVIKKYPNRRLYDTVESRYITLADIRRLVLEKIEFIVIDKKTQEDITRSILLQVISEQEHNGEPMMSQDFLAQIIRSYGGAMQAMVGSYLEQSLKMFQTQQGQMRDSSSSDPIATMAALTQRNLERWRAIQDDIFRAMTSGGPARPRERPDTAASDEELPADRP